MLDRLSHDERLLLLKFVCSFAWADGVIEQGERAFVRRVTAKLEVTAEEAREVERWLEVAPSAAEVDPAKVPQEHRHVFLAAVRGVLFADGNVSPQEETKLRALQARLG